MNSRNSTFSPSISTTYAVVAIALLTGLIYWGGLSGPFLFDDTTNILQNAALRLDTLSPDALWQAAWSLDSGPLKRPISYLSFALNHYFAGGYEPFAFKATNLIIHLLTVWLVYALAARLGARTPGWDARRGRAFALLAAALFALHPLALSPVLYVVQRMASLCTFFVLAALLCWLQARERCDRHRVALGWFLAGGLFFLLGLFTKENAALLPLLYVLMDRALYPQAWYWQWLGRPGPGGRITRITLWLLAALAAALLAWKVAPGYAARPFTLLERQLTEARVLWFYLGLFALPRINAFGLFHDDFVLSTSLFTPWATLPAVVGIAAAVWLGFRLLHRAPMLGFGILWFFAAHLMESTLIPLELVFEHRNYLPMVGLCCATAWLLLTFHEWSPRAAVVVSAAVLAMLAGTTALRAGQWQDDNFFSSYEVAHHPDSARARNYRAQMLANAGDLPGAEREAEAMVGLAPDEVGYRLNHANLVLAQGKPLSAELQAQIESLLRDRKLSVFGTITLKRYSECLQGNCQHLAPYLARWLDVYLASDQPALDHSYAWYMKGLSLNATGDVNGALNAFESAFELDSVFLHPLFEQANIFLALGQWDNAEFNLRRLAEANRRAPVRQDKALQELETAIARGRREAAVPILDHATDTLRQPP